MVAAPIDGLMHHCHIVNSRGNSEQMRDLSTSEPATVGLGSVQQKGCAVIASQNDDTATRPLRIVGLPSPNSWRPLCQPRSLQTRQVPGTQDHASGLELMPEMNNFRPE